MQLSTTTNKHGWYLISMLIIPFQYALPAYCLSTRYPCGGTSRCKSRTNGIHYRQGKCNNAQSWQVLSLGANEDGDNVVKEEETLTEPPQTLQQKTQQVGLSNEPAPFDIAQAMRMMGTSPRRVFISTISSITIALVANLFGLTSHILSLLPDDFSEQSGLDYVYPRDGFKRVMARSSTGGAGRCSFLIPKEWVADTGLALAQAQRQAKSLDFSMTSTPRSGGLPDAAFGPPGKLDNQGLSNGDTNVSVIINSGMKGFNLKESLGEPTDAAEKLISSRFRRPTTLLSAVEIQRTESNVYQFEYIVNRGEKVLPLRAISVIAVGLGGTSYITLTVTSPSPEWDKPAVDEKLRKIVNSLKMF